MINQSINQAKETHIPVTHIPVTQVLTSQYTPPIRHSIQPINQTQLPPPELLPTPPICQAPQITTHPPLPTYQTQLQQQNPLDYVYTTNQRDVGPSSSRIITTSSPIPAFQNMTIMSTMSLALDSNPLLQPAKMHLARDMVKNVRMGTTPYQRAQQAYIGNQGHLIPNPELSFFS